VSVRRISINMNKLSEKELQVFTENDLQGLKVAILDFDGTLALQNKPTEADCVHEKWHYVPYKNKDFYIESHMAPQYMIDFVQKLRDVGVEKIYCLSHMPYSFMLEAKQRFIDKYYGDDIEVIACGTVKDKIDAVDILHSMYSNEYYRPETWIVVDDLWDTISVMRSKGYKAMLPQEVYARFSV
jgi:hypothetical protein